MGRGKVAGTYAGKKKKEKTKPKKREKECKDNAKKKKRKKEESWEDMRSMKRDTTGWTKKKGEGKEESL